MTEKNCSTTDQVSHYNKNYADDPLDEFKKEFKQIIQANQVNRPKTITEKQKAYLNKLHHQSDLAETDFFIAISQLLETPIKNWTDLSSKQISYLINNLLPKRIMTKSQQTLYDFRLQKRRQRVILKSRDIALISKPEYEYGYQIKSEPNLAEDSLTYRLYYLRFYDLAMLDYDNQTWETIQKKLAMAPLILFLRGVWEIRFRVYQTYQGYRIFLMSHPLHYRAQFTFDFLKQMAIDPWYLSFYQHHGFKVRVSPKPGRPETYIAKYLGDWIISDSNVLEPIDLDNSFGLDPKLDKLVKIHDLYCQKFLNSKIIR